jgi:hypothetical protein
MSNEIEWRLTDPDNLQYGRRLNTYVFEFKEFDRINYGRDVYNDADVKNDDAWITDTIDLSTYSAAEIMDYTENYYDNLDELFGIYGADSCFIIAECIFEQTNGLY